jgi:hypothetical protein
MVLALFGADHDEWRTTPTLVGEHNKPELSNKPEMIQRKLPMWAAYDYKTEQSRF